VGQHRRIHVNRSNGKRSKRCGQEKDKKEDRNSAALPVPSMPEVAHYITVGFNSTVRCLQDLARSQWHTSRASVADENAIARKTVAAVFVCPLSSPALLTSSFPSLVAAASARHPSDAPIRLVALPREAEVRLAEALFQPRVGFVGLLQDTPGGKALIDMVVEKVSPVEVSWLNADSKVEYMPVSIMTTPTFPNSE
jgi:ribonuclease P/MRP protein subunit POP3